MGNLRGFCFFSILLVSVFEYSVFGEKANYINDELPYRVQESLLDYSDEIGDRNMTGPIRVIYRKDLDPNYVAYYELQFGDHFYIFSAGPKTKDHRLVQEGKIQRPTDILIEQAIKTNNTCYKFFRLSPDGVTICEDRNERAVATTMDLNTLTMQAANLTTLSENVKKDFKDLKEEWEIVAKEVRSSLQWASTKIYRINQIPDISAIVSETLEPGDSQSLSIGTTKLSDVEISLHYDQAKMNYPNQKINQEVLCLLLGNICTNSTKVNVHKILNTKNNLYSIQFKLNDDYDLIAKKLKDANFYFMLTIRKKTIVLKYYTVRLSQKRTKRMIWSGYREYSIPKEYLMPDYNQHQCCGGCWSGCTPVAWSQIFAYFDRMAHNGYASFYSKYIWQGINGVSGSPYYIAPGNLNSHVQKYVEELRRPLRTFCSQGSGATYSRNSIHLDHWFRIRQRKGRVGKLYSKFQVTKYVKHGYPVMTNIWWVSGGSKSKSGHSVVVTKIKERSRSYKSCRRVGFWWGRRWRCEWKRQYDYLWYRRLGWGGSSNGWYPASFTTAFVAYKTL